MFDSVGVNKAMWKAYSSEVLSVLQVSVLYVCLKYYKYKRIHMSCHKNVFKIVLSVSKTFQRQNKKDPLVLAL